MKTRKVTDRFWSKVSIRGPDECWPWLASLHSGGYGQFGWLNPLTGKYRMRPAHQVAYELTMGPYETGKNVLHSCDNRPCCNPRHLRVGTSADNARDSVERKRNIVITDNPARKYPDRLKAGIRRYKQEHPERQARGERHGRSKLTTDDVHAIRQQARQGEREIVIAAAYGVTYWTVHKIVKRVLWSHID